MTIDGSNPPGATDGLPAVAAGPQASALASARATALAELKAHPQSVSWRRDVAATVLLVLGSTAAVMAAGVWLSIVEPERLRGHLLTLLLLFALQTGGVFAAIAPGKTTLRRLVGLLAIATAVIVVALRGPATPPGTSEFACSISHLAVDLLPLGVVLYSLRRFSATVGRALLAGLAASVTGAIAGELSCGRGWSHVLIHHVGAAIAIAIACVLLARIRPPQSYAP